MSSDESKKVQFTKEELKKRLTPIQYNVTQEAGKINFNQIIVITIMIKSL